MNYNVEIIEDGDHYDVYINNHFFCSADTYIEVIHELSNFENEISVH